MATPSENINTSGGNEGISRGRVDSTLELFAAQRRIDSFAKLLAVSSECIAVTLVNGEIWITANELHKGSQEGNAVIVSIKKIADYFCKVANRGAVSADVDREKVFLAVCSKARIQKKMKGHYNMLKLTDNELEEIAKSVFASHGHIQLESIVEKNSGKASEAALVYTEFTKLYNKFIKLEEALVKPGTLTDEDFQTFKKGKYSICRKEEKEKKSAKKEEKEKSEGQQKESKDVHAEVQLLAHIVDLSTKAEIKPDKVYIGISKLCCLNCRCMIEEANKIFTEKKIKIQIIIRGKHDLDFDWTPPKIFRKGYETAAGSDISGVSDLAFLIGYASKRLIEKLLQESLPAHISLEDSGSQSETEQQLQDKLLVEKDKLNQLLEYLQNQKEDKANIIKGISLALQIYNNTSLLTRLTSVLKILSANKSIEIKPIEIKTNIDFLSSTLNSSRTKETEISANELLEVLQQPFLMGDTLAGYFKGHSLTQEKSNEDAEIETKIDESKDARMLIAYDKSTTNNNTQNAGSSERATKRPKFNSDEKNDE